MKEFLSFIGDFLEALVFIALTGLVGWLVWLSWGAKDVYQLIAAIAVVGIICLLLVVDTTSRILGRMRRLENAIANPTRESKPSILKEMLAKPMPIQQMSTPKPIIKIPTLDEAVERLNKKKAEDLAKTVPAQQTQTTADLKEAVKEIEKVVEEKVTPAPAPTTVAEHEKPADPPTPPVKKYPFGRKPKTEQSQPPVAKAVEEPTKPVTTATVVEDKETSNGNGTHNEDSGASNKVCPKCGVKGQMIKFGFHEGRQKWHCRSCNKTMIEPQRTAGVGA